MKKFWREKNADYYLDKAKVIVPNKEELYESIIEKFEEKIFMLDVIFDESARSKYLIEKSKEIPVGTSIFEIQQKIGIRVIVDFLQLINDLSQFIGRKVSVNEIEITKCSAKEIKENIAKYVLSLKENTVAKLEKIYINILCLSKLLKLDFRELEKERIVIEEKEGSFYKGKYVICESCKRVKS